MIHAFVTKIDERKLAFPFRRPVVPVHQVMVYDVLVGMPLLFSTLNRRDVLNRREGQMLFAWVHPEPQESGQMATVALLDVVEAIRTSRITKRLQPPALEIGWQQDERGWFVSRDTLNRDWQASRPWTRSVRELS